MADGQDAEALRKLLNDGWNYHDSESEHLARELETAADAGIEFDVVAPFLHLSTHAIGEHLGDWARALRLAKRVLDGRTPTLETAKAWGRLYVAAVLAGDLIEAANSELSYLKAAGDDFGVALLDMRFMLAGALVASNRTNEGARLYRGALDLVGQIRQTTLLDRTIAVASNNLGWELHEMSSRSADEDALMQLCAETSLKFWLKCGDWINEERALYLKALVSNVTGSPESGLADADKALAIIASRGQRPLDAARIHLVRASSLAALGDPNGRLRAIGDADAAAANLTAPNLKAQFAAERSKVVGGNP
jgi:hypothetical protein